MVYRYCVILCFLIQIVVSATTPSYPKGTKAAEEGITRLTRLKLNGLTHAVLVRGENKKNPVLLFIHGSGVPSMIFAHLEYSVTNNHEKDFIYVYYDQRGFGKTWIFGKSSKKYATLDTYIKDAEDLTIWIKKQFPDSPIILLCESWGTAIGIHLINRHPDWYGAYVGAGQFNDWMDYPKTLYSSVLNSAIVSSNQTALHEIINLVKPNENMTDKALMRTLGISGKWYNHFNSSNFDTSMYGADYFFKNILGAPEYNIIDFQNTLMSYVLTSKTLLHITRKIILDQSVIEIKRPFFVIQGEFDVLNPDAKAYYDKMSAPKKEYIVINGAGHMVRGEKPAEFMEIIVKRVLPSIYTN